MATDFVLIPNTSAPPGLVNGRAKDVMTRETVAILPRTPLGDAERIFDERGFNGLPVVNEDGLLLGLLTKFDTLRAFAFTSVARMPRYEELLRLPAERVMTRNPRTVHPDTPLLRVLETMVRTRFKTLPVAREGRLVGIVSRKDVLGALRRMGA
jgi:CBS domain-containing protein